MQVHLTLLSLSLTRNLNICTWFPRGEWPLSPLDNSLFLETELIPNMIAKFTFLDSHTSLFPLNLIKG